MRLYYRNPNASLSSSPLPPSSSSSSSLSSSSSSMSSSSSFFGRRRRHFRVVVVISVVVISVVVVIVVDGSIRTVMFVGDEHVPKTSAIMYPTCVLRLLCCLLVLPLRFLFRLSGGVLFFVRLLHVCFLLFFSPFLCPISSGSFFVLVFRGSR